MKERGSALLTVVIATAVLMLISSVLFSFTESQSSLTSSEEKGIIAYSLADAGLQYGIAYIYDNELKKGDSLPLKQIFPDPFNQGGSYTVEWEDNAEGDTLWITSTGVYKDVVRVKQAEYIYYEEDDNGGDDDGGDDDGGGDTPGGGCSEDDPVPNYPAWIAQAYNKNSYVTHAGKAYYNRDYASANQKPGDLWTPWQEITKQWRPNNVYNTNDEVCYNGRKFRAWHWTQNQQPGILNNPWQELTDEWRNFNKYSSGDLVIYGGHQYRAKYYSLNQLPTAGGPWELVQ